MIECIVRGDVLKTALKALRGLVNEARLRFNEDVLMSKAVDPANVAMVLVEVPSKSFEVYKVDCRDDEEVIVGWDVNRTYDFVKSFKKDDLVELKCSDGKIIISADKVKYSVAQIDPNGIRKEPKVPQLELPARIVLPADEVKKAITAAEKVNDCVVFKTDENGFYIEAEGDVDKIAFHVSDAELIEFNKQEARSLFSIEYLKEFMKIAGSGDLLTIKLGVDYPVWMEFRLCGGDCKVVYILAPRIER